MCVPHANSSFLAMLTDGCMQEDEVLFCRTMYGVMRNIAHLCSRKNSQTWGPDAWKKVNLFLLQDSSIHRVDILQVVVCVVADGRKKIHPRVLDCLTLLGVYQPGDHMKNTVNNKEVTAHLFEFTTSFALDPNIQFKYPDKGIVPTQIIFCMKERNQKKINSHRWFFNAFAPMLQVGRWRRVQDYINLPAAAKRVHIVGCWNSPGE